MTETRASTPALQVCGAAPRPVQQRACHGIVGDGLAQRTVWDLKEQRNACNKAFDFDGPALGATVSHVTVELELGISAPLLPCHFQM